MDREGRPNIKRVWLGYIVSIALFGAIIGGFLFLFTDDESRFRLGGVALAIGALITHWLFDRLLPKESSRLAILLIFLDILAVVLVYCLALYVGSELGFIQELLIRLAANPLVWLTIWAVLAIGRLKDCLRLVEQKKLIGRE